MGIKDFFKRKKTKLDEVKKTEDAEVKLQEVKSERKAEKKTAKVKAQPARIAKAQEAKISEAYRVLKTPQVAEKATDLTKENQYVFKVFPKTNKTEIKRAVNE